jgi:hypothetical protein
LGFDILLLRRGGVGESSVFSSLMLVVVTVTSFEFPAGVPQVRALSGVSSGFAA